MTDYELICPRCGEELVDGKCPKCGWIATYFSDQEIAAAKEMFPKSNRIHALIARLEAAERLNATFLEVTDDDSEIDGAVYDAALDAWKKAAGR